MATMDADLQDPPALLPKMYRILREEGYECAAARRADRKGEPQIRSFLSREFYRFAGRLTHLEFSDGARDFRLMSRKMVQAVLELGEYNRFSKGMFSWVGFRTKWLDYENTERQAGKTKWSLRMLFLYALEGIAGFSTAPLMAAAVCGIIFCMLSLLLGTAGIAAFLSGKSLWDRVFLLGGLVFLASGVQLLCAGISSWYLSRIYLEVKHRPIFILQESDGEENAETGLRKEGEQQYGTTA